MLTGGSATAASDIFSAGLILFERLEGRLPFAEQARGEALARRANGVPRPTNGPEWLCEVVGQMLRVVPERRPTAAALADVFEGRGISVSVPDAAFIARRARTIHLPRPTVERAVESWIRAGGTLSVEGPPGMGRSQLIERVRIELLARGRAIVPVQPTDSAQWSALRAALTTIGVEAPVPEGPDAWARSDRWARELLSALPQRAALLVDDAHRLDEGSALVVQALSELGAPILMGADAVPWSPARLSLPELNDVQVRSLVRRILGSTDALEPVCSRVVSEAEGVPGAVVGWTVAAVAAGVLFRRRGRWMWDATALQRFQPDLAGSTVPIEDLDLLGALAVRGGPVGADRLGAVVDMDPSVLADRLDRLVAGGWARVTEEFVRLASPRVQAAVLAAIDDAAGLHRCWLDPELDGPVDTVRHAVGSGDAQVAAAHAGAAVDALLRSDAVAAADLAEEAWNVAPDPAWVSTRIRALGRAGRHELAMQEARSHLTAPGADVVGLWIEIARIEADHRGDHDKALAAIVQARASLGDREAPWELVVAEAAALYQLGDLKASVATARSLAESEAPSAPSPLESWLRARYLWAQGLHEQGDLDGALAVLADVPPELGHGLPAYGVLTAAHGRLLWFAGRYDEAQKALQRAGADDAGLAMLDRARLVNNLGAVRYSVGDTSGALASWERAREMFRRIDAPLEVVRTDVNLCLAYTETGRWDRASAAGGAALDGSRAHAAHDLTCLALDNLAQLAMAREDLMEAWQLLEQALEVAETQALQRERVSVMVRAAEVATMLEAVDAFERAEAAEAEAEAAEMPAERALAAALLATGFARAGDGSAARACTRRAIAPLREAGLARELALVRLWVAEAWLCLGRTEEATGEVSRAAVYAREVGHEPLSSRSEALERRIRESAQPSSLDADLDRLVKLAVAIGERREQEEVFHSIAEAALELAGGERVCVLVGDPPQPVVERVRDGAKPGPISASVLQQAMRDGREVFALDVGERADLRDRESIAAMALRSVVCVPMRHRDQAVGAIYIDSAGASLEGLTKVRRLVRGLAALAALAVVNARHHEQELEHATTVAALEERKKSEAKLLGMASELAYKNEQLSHINVELERATHAKSAFLASMSHEIRTPLSGVLGMARLLEDTPLSEVQRGFVQTICRSGDALLSIINDILDFSKIEARRMDLENIPFDLRTCVEEVADVCAVQAQHKGLELIARVAPDVPLEVEGDPARLRQVLLNLCNNAVKFTDRGHVAIDVSVEDCGIGATRLRFAIEDTGIGIPPDRVVRLFQAFSQVDTSTTRRFGGTGLGLAISRELVGLMGGEVGVESDEGIGSTFWVSVPFSSASGSVRAGDAPIVAHAVVVDSWALRRKPLVEALVSAGTVVTVCDRVGDVDPEAVPAGSVVMLCLPMSDGGDRRVMARLRDRDDVRVMAWTTLTDSSRLPKPTWFEACVTRPLKRERLLRALRGEVTESRNRPIDGLPAERVGRRVLVAEDNVVNQEIARRALERAGFEVVVVGDGRAAVEAVERATWDVVLMDCQMPDMDGYEATRRIRESGCPVPIVAMTANALDGDEEACLASGMDAYLAKPAHPHDLVAMVDRMIAVVGIV